MIKFRQKRFTVEEGHYTGPKDIDKVPGALEVIGKSSLAGGILGGIVGKVVKDVGVLDSAIKGGKIGFVGGILLKMFLNYLHKPMNSIKFQEVDKNIRREFGIYRATGITVGDSVEKRASIEERFSFNDREVTNYKINFCVANNQVTMYTLSLTEEDLRKLNNILDYYCKKYFGMKYSSNVINSRINSYSVSIVFTNYQVISNFIMEVSKTLETKINLLDNEALLSRRIDSFAEEKIEIDRPEEEEEEKIYSVKEINKYDLLKILGKGVILSSAFLASGVGFKNSISFSVLASIQETIKKLSQSELSKSGLPAPRESFGNPYLESVLGKLYYVEGIHYTIGDKKATSNMSMISGRFLVTTEKDSKDMKEIDKSYYGSAKSKIIRSVVGKAITYTYTIQSRNEFEFLLKKLMSTGIKFNIFQ